VRAGPFLYDLRHHAAGTTNFDFEIWVKYRLALRISQLDVPITQNASIFGICSPLTANATKENPWGNATDIGLIVSGAKACTWPKGTFIACSSSASFLGGLDGYPTPPAVIVIAASGATVTWGGAATTSFPVGTSSDVHEAPDAAGAGVNSLVMGFVNPTAITGSLGTITAGAIWTGTKWQTMDTTVSYKCKWLMSHAVSTSYTPCAGMNIHVIYVSGGPQARYYRLRGIQPPSELNCCESQEVVAAPPIERKEDTKSSDQPALGLTPTKLPDKRKFRESLALLITAMQDASDRDAMEE